MGRDKEIFEGIYKRSEAPWTKTEPPGELSELIENERIKPGRAIDIGCGEGFYSVYLASKGFDVLGIDFSEKAVQFSRKNASEHGVDAKFQVLDLTDLSKIRERFDFALEWGILHHIMPPKRQKYAKDVAGLLNKGGKYLSVCFNEQSREFGRPGERYRKSPIGTLLYYSSQYELRKLFKQHFRIIEAKIITMTGGRGQEHTGNFFFMEKQ